MGVWDLELGERAMITTLLRREALKLRATGQTTDSTQYAELADRIELPAADPKPATVTKNRDIDV